MLFRVILHDATLNVTIPAGCPLNLYWASCLFLFLFLLFLSFVYLKYKHCFSDKVVRNCVHVMPPGKKMSI